MGALRSEKAPANGQICRAREEPLSPEHGVLVRLWVGCSIVLVSGLTARTLDNKDKSCRAAVMPL